MVISRSQLTWVFLSLVILRLVIGFHFFTEGKKKIDQGDWTATPFFAAAKGPLAPLFQGLLPDWDQLDTLCVVRTSTDRIGEGKVIPVVNRSNMIETSEKTAAVLDPFRTFGQWDLFLEDVLVGYRLKQSEIAERIQNIDKDLERIAADLQANGGEDGTLARELELQQAERIALKKRLQKADPLNDLLAIIKRRQEQLTDYLYFPTHRDEILKSVKDEDRLVGFVRDGENRGDTATEVASLRGQVGTIEKDIRSIRSTHATEIQGIWNGLEEEMNAYGASLTSPVESGVTMQQKVPLKKPFELNPTRQLYWIDTIVPYFDLAVGVLLLVGLFTRLTSLAAAAFLMGIIATQPLWVPDHDPKIIWNIVEFGALLVLAAMSAGRFGGLDYFLFRLFGRGDVGEARIDASESAAA